jgi:pyridoxine/pyridoxamine 5'-phosphate oxidase
VNRGSRFVAQNLLVILTRLKHSPMKEFQKWWNAYSHGCKSDWTKSFTLCNVDQDGQPNARLMQLLEAKDEGFLFCSHSSGSKGKVFGMNAFIVRLASQISRI